MVNVINKTGEALSPCTEAKARHLLDEHKAEIVTRVPFTIRLNFAVNSNVAPEKESATPETTKRETVEVDGQTVVVPEFYAKRMAPGMFAIELKEMREKYSNKFCCLPASTDEEEPRFFKNSIRGRKFTVGKSFELGRFPKKDDKAKHGGCYPWENLAGQPVKWQVLDIDHRNNAVLLLCQDILFFDYINDKHKRRLEGVENEHFYRWSESDICMYLNTDFLRDFSLDKLPLANIMHETEPGWFYETEPAEHSDEKVFLLSRTEVEKYLPKAQDKVSLCVTTTPKNQQAKRREYPNGRYYGDRWALRSPGNYYNPEFLFKDKTISGPTYVDGEGKVTALETGLVTTVSYGIRPAFWLRIV